MRSQTGNEVRRSRESQRARIPNEAIMNNVSEPKHLGSFDISDLNRHARVRYRCTPPRPGRSFHANSYTSVDALVANVSESAIDLIVDRHVEPGTLVGIEMGNSGSVPYVDLAATITHTEQLENAKW